MKERKSEVYRPPQQDIEFPCNPDEGYPKPKEDAKKDQAQEHYSRIEESSPTFTIKIHNPPVTREGHRVLQGDLWIEKLLPRA